MNAKSNMGSSLGSDPHDMLQDKKENNIANH